MSGPSGGSAATTSPELVRELRTYIARRVRHPWDADDVLQEVLLRLHSRRPQLREDAGLLPWSYRIARNAVIDYYRARDRRREEPHQALPETVAEASAFDDDPAARTREALAGCVAPVLLALPPHYREALTLVELEQRTHAEAARAAGISLSGMKSRVQRGRRRAHALLEDWCAIAYDGRGSPVRCGGKAGPSEDRAVPRQGAQRPTTETRGS